MSSTSAPSHRAVALACLLLSTIGCDGPGQSTSSDGFVFETTPGAATDTLAGDGAADVVAAARPEPGMYVLAVATTAAPDAPVRYLATLSYPGATSVMVSARALSLEDETPVGEVIEATSQIASDNTVSFDFGTVVLPADANPIVPVDLTATLVLTGTLSPRGMCGEASGTVTAPAELSLDGSTWGAAPGSDGPVASCDDL